MERIDGIKARLRGLPDVVLGRMVFDDPDELAALSLIKKERDPSYLKANAIAEFIN